ncbi:MAG: YqgE/AlgH family protein [Acidobacteriota bacterium]|nr:MAG: YqgE/AlgH family protein [Acidobacteriota bacterium]
MPESPINRSPAQLAPGFVVAMPQLLDPNFRRTVVLLLRASEAGSFGLVINRPSSISMDRFCEEQELPYEGPAETPVMIGGPVEADSHLLVLHGDEPVFETGSDRELEIAEGIRLITARDGLARLASRRTERMRCYIGYAGWGPGQIENELEEGAWVPLAADAKLVFDQPAEDVWVRALTQAGIDPIALVPGKELN